VGREALRLAQRNDCQIVESVGAIGRRANVKFALGQILATPGALKALEESSQSPAEFLARHASADWGEVDAEDAKENELSVEQGFRILSAYRTSKGVRLWIITEADRSATTVLLPDEY
jgi:hypothetical protein